MVSSQDGSPTSHMMVYLEQNNLVMKTHQCNQCFKLYMERSCRTKAKDTGDNAPSVFPTEHADYLEESLKQSCKGLMLVILVW